MTSVVHVSSISRPKPLRKRTVARRSLTIIAAHDDNAAQAVAARWRDAGREAHIINTAERDAPPRQGLRGGAISTGQRLRGATLTDHHTKDCRLPHQQSRRLGRNSDG